MPKMNFQQAQLFLDKNWVEEFFNSNSSKIFGQNHKIVVNKIKRSKNLNPASYNILYVIDTGGRKISIRASMSIKYDVDYIFATQKYLYEHGFGEGNILVADPYYFFEDYNLMLYKDVPGNILKHELKEDQKTLVSKIELAAKALKKLHSFSTIPVNLWDPDWAFDAALIGKDYPKFAKRILEIRTNILDEIKNRQQATNLCHGDYSPDNMIFQNSKIYLIDFGSVCFANKEMDLASFVTKLEVMVPYFGNIKNPDTLVESFLSTYGSYDLNLYQCYRALYSIRIINSFAEFPNYEDGGKRIKHAYKIVHRNLKALGLNYE